MPINIIKNNGTRILGNKTSELLISCPTRCHPQVLSWISAGGNATPEVIGYMNTFFNGLDLDGITYGSSGKIKRLNLFCGKTLTDCIRPQVVAMGNTTDTNNNFISTDYIELGINGGLVGDGSAGVGTKRLDTGIVDNTIGSATDFSISTYMKFSALDSGNSSALGSAARSIEDYGIVLPGIWYNVATSGGSGNTTSGFYMGNSTTGPAHTSYRNGVSFATGTGVVTPTVGNLFVFFGAASSRYLSSNCRLASYHFGLYMTSTETLNFYNRIQTFQTSLGRQV